MVVQSSIKNKKVEDNYNPTNKANDTIDKLIEGLILAGMFVATYELFKSMPSTASAAQIASRQATRQEIKAGNIDPTHFSFTGYLEGSMVNMIMAEDKTLLMEAGVPESSFAGMTVVDNELYNTLIEGVVPGSCDIDPAAMRVIISPEELQNLERLLEETKQYGRMADPKTTENLIMENANKISDMVSNYTDVEGYRDGYLLECADVEELILIDFYPASGNTCTECLDLYNAGPYTVDLYPDAPHYGCECEPIIVSFLIPKSLSSEEGVREYISNKINNIYNKLTNSQEKAQIHSLIGEFIWTPILVDKEIEYGN